MKQEEPPLKSEDVFVYPPEADDIKITNVGTLKFDFRDGKVKALGGAKATKGRLPNMQNQLKSPAKGVRSLHLLADKKIRVYTNIMTARQKYPVAANDILEVEMLPFQELYIDILSTNTTISFIASTSLVGFKPIMKRPPSTVGSGNKNVTAAGTAEKLSSSSVPCQAVDISAKRTNDNNIYVGGSNVSSSNGRILAPGDSISFDIGDLNAVYIDADTTGEGVTYLYTV